MPKDIIVKALGYAMLFETIYFANNIVVALSPLHPLDKYMYSGVCFAIHVIYFYLSTHKTNANTM